MANSFCRLDFQDINRCQHMTTGGYGRFARCEGITQRLEYMPEKVDVWFATAEEIAQHINSCIKHGSFGPHTAKFPYYQDGIAHRTTLHSIASDGARRGYMPGTGLHNATLVGLL